MAFKRENRYIVLKIRDALSALSDTEWETLTRLIAKVSWKRHQECRLPLQAVVVESDWPEYEPTWKAIEQRVAREEGVRVCAREGHGGNVTMSQVAGDGGYCRRCGAWVPED